MNYFKNKTIHFIGIGGIGMSAIAEILYDMGFAIQGSNDVENANTLRLKARGIPVFLGQKDISVLKDVDVAIVSSATPKDCPEVLEAERKGIPIGHRSEMLAELLKEKQGIAVAGTHGKTTTSSMISHVLDCAGKEPSFIIGGVLNKYKTNARLGKGPLMVVEADESDGSFLRLPRMISVVTNIDAEHLDYYGSFEREKEAFLNFLNSTDFYGFNVICTDHPVLKEFESQIKRKTFSYGFNETADYRAINEKVANGRLCFDVQTGNKTRAGFELQLFGRHNILNALACIATARQLGVEWDDIKTALSTFSGVERRFTKRGEFQGIQIYDDYAHHPVEIQAVLQAAKQAATPHHVIAFFQPHRYSRAKDLMTDFASCFKDADIVYVSDIYAAGEKPLPDINKEKLVEKIKQTGHPNAFILDGKENLSKVVLEKAQSGDIVVGLGAGDISKWMQTLPKNLGEKK